jgi:recombination protein RecT
MEQTKEVKEEMEISVQQLEQQGLVLPKNITDKVMNTLTLYQQQGTVAFPQNYSVGNALKAAYLIYQNDVKLQKCTNTSVANALLDMCISGLNPSKNQCYFVPMGDQCTLMTSYFGKQTMVKRIKGVIDVRSDVIYKDTCYELTLDVYGNDDIKITGPCPLDKRKSENIIGAWARIILDPEVWGVETYTAIMTLEDIQNAWSMGSAYGKSKAHQKFMGEMAKKSAINRCIKNFINTRDDQDILIDTLNRVTSNEYKPDVYDDVQYQVREEQASQVIDISQEPQESPKPQTQPNAPKEEKQATAQVKQEQMGIDW